MRYNNACSRCLGYSIHVQSPQAIEFILVLGHFRFKVSYLKTSRKSHQRPTCKLMQPIHNYLCVAAKKNSLLKNIHARISIVEFLFCYFWKLHVFVVIYINNIWKFGEISGMIYLQALLDKRIFGWCWKVWILQKPAAPQNIVVIVCCFKVI